MEYDYFRSMDSGILLTAEGPQAAQGFESVRRFIEDSEKRFTRFSQSSELVQLNRAAGSWQTVSPEMFDLLEIALKCHQTTNGLFDPSILPELEQAGYTHSLSELQISGADPGQGLRSRKRGPAFSAIQLRPVGLSILLPKGLRIDLGGLARGWIAQQAAQRLSRFSTCCAVDVDGDMFFWGTPREHSGWEVGLEDPRHPSEDLRTLQVQEGAVATSSVTKRVWKQGSTSRHHLIDPRSGEPAQTPWLSVTVLAPCAASAEAFAKAILIAGPEEAGALIERNPQITCFVVEGSGHILSFEKHEKVYQPVTV